MSHPTFLLIPILLPVVVGLLAFVLPRTMDRLREMLVLVATLAQVGLLVALGGAERSLSLDWAGFGMDLAFRWSHFPAFITIAAAGFSALVVLYSFSFMRDRPNGGAFYGWLLLNLSFTTGAVLADNLVAMLFFWEGLLVFLYGMIATGGPGAHKTALKALVLVGVSDLCLMLGIALTGHLAGTLTLSEINLPLTGLGSVAFLLLAIGATSKAGALPFHTWIPDAAVSAPLPFMAFLPAALEKLLGIYFLARISLDLFQLRPESWVSHVLMILGAVTILVAVMMALVQKDYKRLLSYHAISQVGYMILGIGTALPVGIVGGLFHMINHAMYKCTLFLTAGAVEQQAGTTDLRRLGGLQRAMPVTFWSFVVAAAAISGVPPFNGFFSKELVYDGALERSWLYYAAALLGSLLTGASFLKLGHAAYVDRPRQVDTSKVHDPGWAMRVPMLLLVAGCVLFGVVNALPLRYLIQPILGETRLLGHDYSGLPHSWGLVAATLVVVGLAVGHHWLAVRRHGLGLKAADHIHHAPLLHPIYRLAERRYFDSYDVGMFLVQGFSHLAFGLDRVINWFYDVFSVRTAQTASRWILVAHSGGHAATVAWSLAGALVVAIMVGLSV